MSVHFKQDEPDTSNRLDDMKQGVIGAPLPRPIIEFSYKDDKLGDPLVTEEHIAAFGWASPQDIDDFLAMTLRVNDFLTGVFMGIGIKLIDLAVSALGLA